MQRLTTVEDFNGPVEKMNRLYLSMVAMVTKRRSNANEMDMTIKSVSVGYTDRTVVKFRKEFN